MLKYLFALLFLGAAGCASHAAASSQAAPGPQVASRPIGNPGQAELPGTKAGTALKVDMQKGYLSQQSAEDPIEARWKDFVACYDKAGDAQRYAAGRVMLRFLIRADGRPGDVRVIETGLGNWDVERCLVNVGRSLRFAPPEGGQGTEFEYPIEFRSRREVQVSDAAVDKLPAAVTYAAGRASECGCVVPAGDVATVTAYVEPGGAIGSAGFASEAPLDERVGACLLQRLRAGKVAMNATRLVARAVSVPLPACAETSGR